jgi:hypothetical protein
VRDAVERDVEFIVAAQVVAQADEHGALQHVRIAVGRPGVADAVVAAEHRHAGLPAGHERRHDARWRRAGDQHHAELRHACEQHVALAFGQFTEAEAMADRYLALHAERGRALQDQFEREGTHRARLVQMDVDRAGMAFGDAEERVERTHRIGIDRTGVEAAQHIGAFGHRTVEQFRRAGSLKEPRLRKGHDLDLLQRLHRAARANHAFEMAKAGLRVDVDMSSQPRGAEREKGFGERERLPRRSAASISR